MAMSVGVNCIEWNWLIDVGWGTMDDLNSENPDLSPAFPFLGLVTFIVVSSLHQVDDDDADCTWLL